MHIHNKENNITHISNKANNVIVEANIGINKKQC